MTEQQYEFYRQAAIDGGLPDSKNPIFLFSMTNTELLVLIALGRLDVHDLAIRQLKDRGLNEHGLPVDRRDDLRLPNKRKTGAQSKKGKGL